MTRKVGKMFFREIYGKIEQIIENFHINGRKSEILTGPIVRKLGRRVHLIILQKSYAGIEELQILTFWPVAPSGMFKILIFRDL